MCFLFTAQVKNHEKHLNKETFTIVFLSELIKMREWEMIHDHAIIKLKARYVKYNIIIINK